MTAPRTDIHPMIKSQLFTGRGATAEVAAAAKHLADLMQKIHGGDWRVQIEHSPDAALIVIAQKPERKGVRS